MYIGRLTGGGTLRFACNVLLGRTITAVGDPLLQQRETTTVGPLQRFGVPPRSAPKWPATSAPGSARWMNRLN